jgi:hypothetical protein
VGCCERSRVCVRSLVAQSRWSEVSREDEWVEGTRARGRCRGGCAVREDKGWGVGWVLVCGEVYVIKLWICRVWLCEGDSGESKRR